MLEIITDACYKISIIIFTIIYISMISMIFFLKCKKNLLPKDVCLDDNLLLFECFCGFGLGCSFSALFCRVGGGIFTKGCDISCDIIGKVTIY